MDPTERSAKQRRRYFPPEVAAVWGAFLLEGLSDSLLQGESGEVPNLQERRHLDVLVAACNDLPRLWREILPYWDSQVFDYPGVFESEVVSELGSRFGDHFRETGSAPTEAEIHRLIRQLVEAFVRDYEIVDSV